MKPIRLILSLAALVALCGLAGWWWAGPREHPAESERHRGSHAPAAASAGSALALHPPLLPPDSAASSHPVVRAVAGGVVLESRFEPGPVDGRWTRTRLVQTKVQPRPVRVVEEWKQTPGTGAWVCQRCDMYLADQLIVKARAGISADQLRQQLAPLGLALEAKVAGSVFTVRLPKADLDAAPAGLRLLAAHTELAETAEMDGVGFGGGLPDDPLFGQQWGLHNTGQSGGTVGADVDASDFWNIIESTPGIVIAVLDSGLNFTHPDLQNVAWVNPGEIAGDGVDNDGDGFVDDVNGWDFVNNDNLPADDHGHGSNVSGIIAATRDNGTGVAGLISGAHILVCKILNSSNSGTTSNLIAATTYARLRGAPIFNLSLQNYPYSSILADEFNACENAGILLCICAGNQGVDNDATPNYPSCYPNANIIAVGNHDRTDVRWSGASNPSNFGLNSVDLFAPGREILSPVLGTDYQLYTGTSQATPFVTAVAAALKYLNPTWQAPEIKSRILHSVVVLPSYSGICVSGGRLNAAAALVKASQTISFGPLASRTFGDPSFTVSATASSGLAPAYSIVSGPATISGSTVTLTGIGTVVVRAAQAGDLNYDAATSMDQGFTVSSGSSLPPTLTSASTASGVIGQTLVYPADFSGTPTSYSVSGLPTGLGFDAATGVIFGAPAASGTYLITLRAVNGAGTGEATLTLTVSADGGFSSRLVNLSVRTGAGTGDNSLIVGMVIGGSGTNGPKPLLLRCAGPALVNYGVAGFLADPAFAFIRQGDTAPIATNDNWAGDPMISAVGDAVGAFPFVDAASKDAALYLTPTGGAYSMVIAGIGSTTGIALAEVYDASGANYNALSPRLVNISARAQVGTGDNVLIAGFVISGTTPRTVLVRAVGPTLSNYNVGNVLTDPQLDLIQNVNGTNVVIASNDNWGGASYLSTYGDAVGAFDLASPTSKDAAILVTLPPGIYSAKASGVGGTTGVALIEVYEVP